jgi:anthranilate synthase/aminodeoxychorismate synthase-like glutamine amidotransferase
MNPRLLLIDNYDSFTWNLAQAFMTLGAEVWVHRNDAITVEQAKALAPTHLCLSPGPGRPEASGVCLSMLHAFEGVIPVLGVCLGHQAITIAYGGVVDRAPRLMHGKASLARHDGDGLFAGLPQPMPVARYHSLAAVRSTLPPCLAVTAETEDAGEIMAIAHRTLPVVGVQFHPESVLTPDGPALLSNFLTMSAS